MQKQRIVIIAVIIILTLAAFKTIIPSADASKECILGYKAFCSFTPISTAILIIAAISIFFSKKETILGRTT